VNHPNACSRQEHIPGNHDDSALAAHFKVGQFRDGVLPKSYAYVEKFSEEDVKWLSELPYTISIPHLKAMVVHAGIVPGLPLGQQTAAHMSRIRSVLRNEGEHGGYEGVDFIKLEKGACVMCLSVCQSVCLCLCVMESEHMHPTG